MSVSEEDVIVSDGENHYEIPGEWETYFDILVNQLNESQEYSDEWYVLCDKIDQLFGSFRI